MFNSKYIKNNINMIYDYAYFIKIPDKFNLNFKDKIIKQIMKDEVKKYKDELKKFNSMGVTNYENIRIFRDLNPSEKNVKKLWEKLIEYKFIHCDGKSRNSNFYIIKKICLKFNMILDEKEIPLYKDFIQVEDPLMKYYPMQIDELHNKEEIEYE